MTKAIILKRLQNDSEEFVYNKEKFTLTMLGSTGKNEENVLYFENESGSKEVAITVELNRIAWGHYKGIKKIVKIEE